jgi:UDP-N-acetylglucosamine--N-acetylmuramyl-(pentapeptide) pyrophosphoryl-undecaprenol N-acetylglucosamine transferase
VTGPGSGGAVFLAGGGTGGHVFPSLAVAAAVRELAPDVAVEFVGTSRGLESRLVPAAGWPLHTVDALPLARRLSLSTLRVPGVLLAATRRVRRLLDERRAVAAVVFGGYVSVPLALAARRARVPLIVHEQNAVPGLANRLAARWAVVAAVTYPGQRFGRTPVEVTGNPVRPGLGREAVNAGRAEALEAFGLDADRSTLLVFGGSQGARRLNSAVVAAQWSAPDRLQILHATGRRDAVAVSDDWRRARESTPERMPLVSAHEFIDRMDLAYAAADVVLCRAGASTLAELTVLGLPSVLVPYPHATADHQTANARALQEAGAAVTVPDAELDARRLVDEVEPLLLDADRRERMAAAAAAVGRPDAGRRVAQLVLAHLRTPVKEGRP